jgi:hypothetical protein
MNCSFAALQDVHNIFFCACGGVTLCVYDHLFWLNCLLFVITALPPSLSWVDFPSGLRRSGINTSDIMSVTLEGIKSHGTGAYQTYQVWDILFERVVDVEFRLLHVLGDGPRINEMLGLCQEPTAQRSIPPPPFFSLFSFFFFGFRRDGRSHISASLQVLLGKEWHGELCRGRRAS